MSFDGWLADISQIPADLLADHESIHIERPRRRAHKSKCTACIAPISAARSGAGVPRAQQRSPPTGHFTPPNNKKPDAQIARRVSKWLPRLGSNQ